MDEETEHNFSKTMAFKDICLIHLKRIAEISCCEFRGGYHLTVTDKSGSERELYVEDTRERYSNAVLTLAHLLLPKFDKLMKDKYQKHSEAIQKLKQVFLDATSIKEKQILGESYYQDVKDKVLLEEFKIEKLELFRSLFSELSLLLGRLNYFETGGATY